MLPEQLVEHLVAVAGGGDDALGAGPVDRGVGAGLEILTQDISNHSSLETCLSMIYDLSHFIFVDD